MYVLVQAKLIYSLSSEPEVFKNHVGRRSFHYKSLKVILKIVGVSKIYASINVGPTH